MPKIAFNSVDDYIASQPEDSQRVLEKVRNAIHKAVPKAQEAISYNIPALRLDGDPILWFAVWKRHYSLYPASARLVAALEDELVTYEIRKSTIRFPLSEPVPEKLIGSIAAFRAAEPRKSVKASTAATKKHRPSQRRPA